MRIILIAIISAMLSTALPAQQFDRDPSSAELETKPLLFLSNYGFRFGVVRTAPGVIVENTDKNTSGHIQDTANYGYVLGIFSAPERDTWFDFFIHLDYYSFSMDQQLLNHEISMDLGTEVTGNATEFVPGVALILSFFNSSYISVGLGYGIKVVSIEGNLYLTDGDISVNCLSAVGQEDKASIKTYCERHGFNENVLTYSFVNTVDVKLGDFLFRWTTSTSNSSGNAEDSS